MAAAAAAAAEVGRLTEPFTIATTKKPPVRLQERTKTEAKRKGKGKERPKRTFLRIALALRKRCVLARRRVEVGRGGDPDGQS